MSVYLRGKGKIYQIKFVVNGKQYGPVSSKTSDKKLAELVETKMRGEVTQIDNNFAKAKLTLGQVLDKYLIYAKRQMPERNYGQVETILSKMKKFFGAGTSAFDITLDMVNDYANSRREEGIAKVTVDTDMVYLRAAYRQRIKAGIKIDNPVTGYVFCTMKERRERRKAIMRQLDEAELKLFLSHCPEDLKLLIQFDFAVGLRQSEVLNVKWADLNFQKNMLKPPRGKGGLTDEVPVYSLLMDQLAELPRVSEYVFGTENGKAGWTWYRKRFEKARKEVKEKYGLRHFRFHDLRHSFANYLLEKGYDGKTISLLLGHTTTAMFDQVYAHPSDRHKRAAVENMPRGLFEIGDKIGTSEKADTASIYDSIQKL